MAVPSPSPCTAANDLCTYAVADADGKREDGRGNSASSDAWLLLLSWVAGVTYDINTF